LISALANRRHAWDVRELRVPEATIQIDGFGHWLERLPIADDQQDAATWRQIADGFRPRWPRLATLLDAAEDEVLAYLAFAP
jgi:hypothetical protein